MSEILIERQHALGLSRAREVAQAWVAQAQEKWGLQFRREPWPGDSEADGASDTLRFNGMGAEGEVEVSAQRFVVRMTLGGLMAAFAPMVEDKMTRKLDALLTQEH